MPCRGRTRRRRSSRSGSKARPRSGSSRRTGPQGRAARAARPVRRARLRLRPRTGRPSRSWASPRPPRCSGTSPSAARSTRALDVGTGSGIQAVLAARHADLVVATDVSERALAFAAFNAALNGFDNVELRQGSFFEPVAGERFELVVSNPPFVVSPDLDAHLPRRRPARRRRLRAGRPRGGRARGGRRVRPLPRSPGRTSPAATGRRPCARWVEGSGCDPVVLRYTTDDPLTYAARWNPPAQTPDLPETLDRWLAYYAELGIEAIAYGAIALRRREGSSWVLAEDAPERIEPASGTTSSGLFEAQDFLADGRDLAYERLVLVDEHVLEQALHLDDGVFGVRAAAIRLTDGLGFQAEIDVFTAHIVSRLDGKRTVREAIADTAEMLGPEGMTPGSARRERRFRRSRRMVQLGFLVPAPLKTSRRGVSFAPDLRRGGGRGRASAEDGSRAASSWRDRRRRGTGGRRRRLGGRPGRPGGKRLPRPRRRPPRLGGTLARARRHPRRPAQVGRQAAAPAPTSSRRSSAGASSRRSTSGTSSSTTSLSRGLLDVARRSTTGSPRRGTISTSARTARSTPPTPRRT